MSLGGDWPERARAACLALTAAVGEDDARASSGIRLLADIGKVVGPGEFVPTRDLIYSLCKLDESPWRDMDLTARALADLQRPSGHQAGL